VLKHRLYLSIEASLTNTIEDIFEEIMKEVPTPVESGVV
jgi:MoxR-like ATPase